ncbi:MAG TPA: hypothetical protein VG605_24120, partial [Puia sp.]|nr:hypothetical protein [Puia sp.]
IWRYRSVSATLGQNGPEPVDTALKAAIGNASTDIVPWNVSRIWSNGLRYDPRPTIQSFYAFNSWLDSLNYEKYMSPGAPRYVLLSFARVDGHFPFFDEARTKLALLSQYDAVTELGGELLLKNADRRRLQPAGEETVTVKLNSDIAIKRQDSLLQFSRFYLHYDCTGKTGRWLDHPPGLKITLTLNDGSSFTYRISKSVLEDGVIVNKYVDEEEELQLLMQARGRLTPNIAKINIDSDSTGVGFVDSVTMVNAWYAFREPTMEERAADSSGIARLYDRSRPELFPVDSLAPGSFPYQLDEFNTFSQFIRVNVSLPRLRGLAAPPPVRPVLRSRDHFFRLPEFKQSGPELISVAAKDLLPPGDYELGLAKEKDSGGKKWIVSYTGRHLFIRSDYKITESGPLVPNSEGNVDMKYNIDRAFIWKGQVLIEGWALMQKKDTGKTTTTIVLSSPGRTYRLTTDPQERSDVGGPGSYCGFSVKIPESRLVRDKYIIAIEQTCCNGRFHNLQYSSRILKPGMDNDVQLPLPAPVLPATTNYLSGIDRFDDEKEFMTIEGWAIGAMDQVQDSRIYIILRSDSAAFVYRTVMEKRTDLTAHYHNGFNLDNCGFSAKMSKEMLPPGKYTVGLWVRPDDGPGWVKYLSLYSVKDAN